MPRPFIDHEFGRLAVARVAGSAIVGCLATLAALAVMASPVSARSLPEAFTANWCSAHGANFARWAGSSPNIAICGPGPGYGGGWSYVNVPGPAGTYAGYQNATPGFQCVELAERYLALAYGFSAVPANGAQVAANYHAAYPRTALYPNGTVGHAPVRGDVISFASSSQFQFGDGHVAIVTKSSVNSAGDGTVTVAQENVSAADYVDTLGVSNWRLFDPTEPTNAEFQYPAAEWLHVTPLVARAATHSAFLPNGSIGQGHLMATDPSLQGGSTLSYVLSSFHVSSAMKAVTRSVPAADASPRTRLHPNGVLTGSEIHGYADVRAVSGVGLGIVFALCSLALLLAGARHRRLQHPRRFGAHSAGHGPASRRLASGVQA